MSCRYAHDVHVRPVQKHRSPQRPPLHDMMLRLSSWFHQGYRGPNQAAAALAALLREHRRLDLRNGLVGPRAHRRSEGRDVSRAEGSQHGRLSNCPHLPQQAGECIVVVARVAMLDVFVRFLRMSLLFGVVFLHDHRTPYCCCRV